MPALKAAQLKKIESVALLAALEAGKLLARKFRHKLRIREKGAEGLVTDADLAAEKIIKRRLTRAFPEFAFVGEESHDPQGTYGDAPVWYVDPLDGTTNFAYGFPVYCVSIGLAIGNKPEVGVIHAPSLGETWYSSTGNGAFHNKKRIHVSKRAELSDCLLSTGFAYQKGRPLLEAVARFGKVSMESRAVRRPGAAALDLAYLAMGVFDGFWERGLKSWDVCAGANLVREAGGRITDYHGKEADLTGQEFLATNGKIHAAMVATLSA